MEFSVFASLWVCSADLSTGLIYTAKVLQNNVIIFDFEKISLRLRFYSFVLFSYQFANMFQSIETLISFH